jgi:lysophospholipase L1-like esterase
MDDRLSESGTPGAAPHSFGGRQARWTRRLAAHGLLLVSDLLALAGALLVLEIAIRANSTSQIQGLELQGFLENDGRGSFRSVPGFQARQASERGWIDISLNSLGLRGSEIGPRRADEKRILVLGDSHVFGLGVQAEETLPAALERQLRNALDAPVACANAGIPSNGTVELLRDYERHRAVFDPDAAVVCVHLGTDFEDDVVGPREVVEGFAVSTDVARFVKGSLRARLALRLRAWFEIELGLAELSAFVNVPGLSMGHSEPNAEELGRFADFPPPEVRAENVFMDVKTETPAMARILDRTERGLAAIRDAAKPRPVAVLVIPSWTSVFQGRYGDMVRNVSAAATRAGLTGLAPEEFEKGLCAKRLARRCQENLGVPCLDLTPLLEGRDDLYLTKFLHFNAAGNEFVAREATRVLAPLLRSPRDR